MPKLEGGAEIGDFVTADLKFHKDGEALNEVKEIQFRLQPELRFQDGHVPDLAGALAGSSRARPARPTPRSAQSSPDPRLRGQAIGVDLRRQRPEDARGCPRSTPRSSAGSASTAWTTSAIGLRGVLDRRLEFQKRDAIRREILDQLVDADPVRPPGRPRLPPGEGDPPPPGPRPQAERPGRQRDPGPRGRAPGQRPRVDPRRASRSSSSWPRSPRRRGSRSRTPTSTHEIEAMATRTDESPRRVRARIEKEGLGDALASQILERKTIDRIIEFVKFEDVALVEDRAVETIDETAGDRLRGRGPRRSPRAEAARRPDSADRRPRTSLDSEPPRAATDPDAAGRPPADRPAAVHVPPHDGDRSGPTGPPTRVRRRARPIGQTTDSDPSVSLDRPGPGVARPRDDRAASPRTVAMTFDQPLSPAPRPALPRLRPAAADDPRRPPAGEPDRLPRRRRSTTPWPTWPS